MTYHAADELLDFRRQRLPCGQAPNLLVQALPLQWLAPVRVRRPPHRVFRGRRATVTDRLLRQPMIGVDLDQRCRRQPTVAFGSASLGAFFLPEGRSEERRVGK